MKTRMQSFRLTEQAKVNLTKLSQDYSISESKVINILLTEQSAESTGLENTTAAAEIIEAYFTDLALSRIYKVSN